MALIIRETVAQRIYYAIRLMIIIALFLVVVTALLNVAVFRQIIVHPIRTVVEMLKDISEGEGDLTKRLMVKSRDEIGAMAEYFNHTFDKIKTLVAVIKQQSTSLLNNGNELDNRVKTISVQEEHIRKAITQLNRINQIVKSGAMEMLSGSQEVIKESENLDTVTHQLADGVSEMAVSIELINTAINHVNTISGENKECIGSLVQEVERFKIE